MKTNLDWNKLKLFYYVAQTGSFTKAAEILHMTQPSLSRSIQNIEYQLKTSLFERVNRGIVLTEKGKDLFDATEKAFEEFTRAEIKMLDKENEPQGTLNVTTSLNLSPGWFVPLMEDFLNLYPKIQLNIIGSDEDLALKTHVADVSLRPYIVDNPRLLQDFICTFTFKLYASKSYLSEYGIPKLPKDLNHHKLIVFGDNGPLPYPEINWLLKLGATPKTLRVPSLCINCSLGMQQAAEAGLGIVALVDDSPLSKNKLIEILPEIKKPILSLYYVYPEHLKESKKVKVFGDYLKKIFDTSSHEDKSTESNILNFKLHI